ncbi:hypothetical protein OAM67_00975 [bacterium]|nr:hypothetical protein [bacterium]
MLCGLVRGVHSVRTSSAVRRLSTAWFPHVVMSTTSSGSTLSTEKKEDLKRLRKRLKYLRSKSGLRLYLDQFTRNKDKQNVMLAKATVPGLVLGGVLAPVYTYGAGCLSFMLIATFARYSGDTGVAAMTAGAGGIIGAVGGFFLGRDAALRWVLVDWSATSNPAQSVKTFVTQREQEQGRISNAIKVLETLDTLEA